MDKVIEVETLIHSINVSDGKGKEVVLLVNTDINNNRTFFTDSNGLAMQKRILNHRPTWELEVFFYSNIILFSGFFSSLLLKDHIIY